MDNQSDRQLLQQFIQDRSEAAFELLVQRHGPMVYAVCRRIVGNNEDAQDCVQAVFLTLAHKAAALQSEKAIAPWLHHVAWCVATNARQSRAIRRRRENEAPAMIAQPKDLSDDGALTEVLDSEIQALPAKYRTPLILFHLEGRTYQEISATLNCKTGTLESWLSRGRELLRERLARRGVVMPSAMITPMLAAAATSQLPSALVNATTQAAVALSAGQLPTLSAQALLLSKGALKMLFMAKIKVAALAALVSSLLFTAIGAAAWHVMAGEPQAVENKPAPAAKEVKAPATVNGLQFSVSVAKEKFGAQEPLAFTLSFKNVSEEPFYLHDTGHYCASDSPYSLVFESADGKETIQSVFPLRVSRVATESELLQAGKTFGVKIDTRQIMYQTADRKLKPGSYRLKLSANLTNNPSRNYGHKHWTGKIDAVTSFFTVDSRNVVVVDGLEFQVASALEKYQAGAPLQFVLSYKNVSDKPYYLYDLAHYRSAYSKYVLDFHNEETGQNWRGFYTIEDERTMMDSTLLEAGKSIEVKLDLAGISFKDTKELPPGRYRLKILAKITPNPHKKTDTQKHWTGQIEGLSGQFTIEPKH